MKCRVCEAVVEAPVFARNAPAVTSMATLLEARTEVFFCTSCGHVQGPDIFDLVEYYANGYRISLEVEDHDQLYAMKDGEPIYRTDFQADIVSSLIDLGGDSIVLDYGAAKAETLGKLVQKHSGIVPHVFDVSEDYRDHWSRWIPLEQQACFSIPEDWAERFDLVTAHFVLEHVGDPVAMLSDVRNVLKPAGKLFLSVPDVIGNVGDFLVVDHVNRFTLSSLHTAFSKAGLQIETIRRDLFRGAFVIVASNESAGSSKLEYEESLLGQAESDVNVVASFWQRAFVQLEGSLERLQSKSSVIYGAGFYGAVIGSVIVGKTDVRGFVDQNPYARENLLNGLPVFAPESVPADVDLVYAGLNPALSRKVLEAWKSRVDREDLTILYLD